MRLLLYSFVLFGYTCGEGPTADTQATPTGLFPKTGSFEVFDPRFLDLVDTTSGIEILAEGFDWSEGPLWVASEKSVLFSDIPPNKIMKWSEKKGLETWLHPSGYTGSVPRKGEPGSNGLLLDPQGRLVLCQHGDRRMARMDAPLNAPRPVFSTIADRYEGKRLNSPNDAVFHKNGDLYFTDPPYGLLGNIKDPAKELDFQGVYRVDQTGKVHLITKELSRPNGIAFSPDYQTLYVANSDTRKIWMAYRISSSGNVTEEKLFFDASADTTPGHPDGLKVHPTGIVFATGPGGAILFTPEGRMLGKIRPGQLCSNLAFDDKFENLYITADAWLVRVRLKRK